MDKIVNHIEKHFTLNSSVFGWISQVYMGLQTP